MAVDLARYIVSLEAQTATYVRELDKANRKLDRFHKDQQRAIGQIKKAFLQFGATLASALSVTAIVNFTKASVQMGDQLGEISRAAGVGAETLQELRFAFDALGGIASGETDQGLQRFNRQLGLAINGSRQAQQQFQLLGVAFKDSLGRGRATDATLEATLKALGAIENDAQRAAIAGRLFGQEMGPKLAAALKGGSRALDDARQQVVGLISEESVRKAEALDDAFKRMALTIGGPLKEAAIAAAFELAKIFGLAEDSSVDILNDKIARTSDEIKRLENTLAAQVGERDSVDWLERLFGMDEAEWDRRIAETRSQLLQLRQNLMVFQAAARGPTSGGIDDGGVQEFSDGLEEISTSFGKLPSGFRQFDGAAAAAFVLNSELQEISVKITKMPDDLQRLSPEFNAAVASLVKYNERLNETQEAQRQLAESIGAALTSTLANAFLGIETNFKDLLKRMAAELFASSLVKGLASFAASSGTGGVAGFFGKIFGGFRANGGPVSAGRAYVVGETGPEIFVPSGSGMIMAGAGGGPNVMINQHNTFNGGDPRQQAAALAANNQRLKAEIFHELRRGRG